MAAGTRRNSAFFIVVFIAENRKNTEFLAGLSTFTMFYQQKSVKNAPALAKIC